MIVILKQGEDEGVWMKKQAKENLDWSQDTDVLTIQLTDAAKASESFFNDGVTVILKNLEGLKTKAHFENIVQEELTSLVDGQVIMKGFMQRRFNLLMDDKTNVMFDGLMIDTLHARIGKENLGTAILEIGSENEIKVASFDIPGKSILTLNNPAIGDVQYHLSSDAKVSLEGKPAQKLND